MDSDFGDLALVDELIDNASRAIDQGRYNSAVEIFEQVIDLTESIFGDNIELMELRSKIVQIQEMLEGMNRDS